MSRGFENVALFDAAAYQARRGHVAAALELALADLDARGALEPVDAVHVALLRTLAEQVDAKHAQPDPAVVSIVAGSRAIAELLSRLVVRGRRADDGFDELVAALQAPAAP